MSRFAGKSGFKSFLVLLSVSLLLRPVFADSNESIYTDLSSGKCRAVKDREDVEYAVEQCPGAGEYSLLTEYSDQRQSVTVVTPAGKEYPLDFWNLITPAFSHLGKKAEWRVVKTKGKIIPKALIVRVYGTASADAPTDRGTSYLAVAKITPQVICVTDRIEESASANEAARKVADRSEKRACLKTRHTQL